MREALLEVIIAGICILGLVRPQFGLYGYIWYGLLRPDALAWAYGSNKGSLYMAIATLIGSVATLPKILAVNPKRIGLAWFTLILLQIPIVLSVIFAVNPPLASDALSMYWKIILIALLIPLLVTELKELRQLLVVISVSLGLLGAKFGSWGILHGGARFSQGHAGFLGDNNDLALALAMVVPLLWYCGQMVTHRWAKLLLYGMALSNVAAVVMTYSRGGAISLGVVFLLIVWYSRHKLLMLMSLALVSLPILMLVGSSYIDRLSTIQTRVEERSAYSRIVLAKIGVKMWQDYPLLGVGFGRLNQQALIYRYLPNDVDVETWSGKVLHNTYIQLLVDSGAIAFLIYVGLLLGMIVALMRSARRIRTICPHLLPYPRGIQIALMAFAVGATFLSRVEFDLYYFLLMAGQIWLRLEPSLVQEAMLVSESSAVEDGFASAGPARPNPVGFP